MKWPPSSPIFSSRVRVASRRRGNVLGAVEMNDVKDDGNDDHVFTLALNFALLSGELELAGGLHCRCTRLRTLQEQHLFSVVDGARGHAVVRMGLGEQRGDHSQEGHENRQAERRGLQHGFEVNVLAGCASYAFPFHNLENVEQVASLRV